MLGFVATAIWVDRCFYSTYNRFSFNMHNYSSGSSNQVCCISVKGFLGNVENYCHPGEFDPLSFSGRVRKQNSLHGSAL